MTTKNTANEVAMDDILRTFGASKTEERSLTADVIQWDSDMQDKVIVLQFISRKSVNGRQGAFDMCNFYDNDHRLRTASFGVNTSAFDVVEPGDVVKIIYRGTGKTSAGRKMNKFDISIIGHGEL